MKQCLRYRQKVVGQASGMGTAYKVELKRWCRHEEAVHRQPRRTRHRTSNHAPGALCGEERVDCPVQLQYYPSCRHSKIGAITKWHVQEQRVDYAYGRRGCTSSVPRPVRRAVGPAAAAFIPVVNKSIECVMRGSVCRATAAHIRIRGRGAHGWKRQVKMQGLSQSRVR